MSRRWLVFNVGCIECGVSSDVVGMYGSEAEAQAIADALNNSLSWRDGGQNSFEVFDLEKPQADEYVTAIARATQPLPPTSEVEK